MRGVNSTLKIRKTQVTSNKIPMKKASFSIASLSELNSFTNVKRYSGQTAKGINSGMQMERAL